MADRRTQLLDAAVRVIARNGVRGLRVEELAAEASVSTGLIYYHFGDRAGLLVSALGHVNQRAVDYTSGSSGDMSDHREGVEAMLLAELSDDESVRLNSIAWGELRATSVFNDELREPLKATTASWAEDVGALIVSAQEGGQVSAAVDTHAVAEHLTALVEGLSMRWHSESITLQRAQELLGLAIRDALD